MYDLELAGEIAALANGKTLGGELMFLLASVGSAIDLCTMREIAVLGKIRSTKNLKVCIVSMIPSTKQACWTKIGQVLSSRIIDSPSHLWMPILPNCHNSTY
jgi:hypothetical protein